MKKWLIVIGVVIVVPGGVLLLAREIHRAVSKNSDEVQEEEELAHTADYARMVGC